MHYQGQPCKRGHSGKRLVSSGQCVECKIFWAREERANRPELGRARALRHHYAHQSESNQRSREYHAANRDMRLVQMREWKAANKRPKTNTEKAKLQAWRDANREKVRAYHAKWLAANPEKQRLAVRVCATRRRKAEGRHTMADVQSLMMAQGCKCNLCSCDISQSYHVDHVIPIAKGGTHWPHNLQLLCPTCNRRKGARLLEAA